MFSIKLNDGDKFMFFYLFFFCLSLSLSAEVEAERHGSAAHGQWPLPGQPDPDRPSGHHTVSPPDGQPVLGAANYHLSHGGRGRGRGRRGADSGPGLQRDSGDHICTLSVAWLRDERSENCTFVMSTSSSCSLVTRTSLKTF